MRFVRQTNSMRYFNAGRRLARLALAVGGVISLVAVLPPPHAELNVRLPVVEEPGRVRLQHDLLVGTNNVWLNGRKAESLGDLEDQLRSLACRRDSCIMRVEVHPDTTAMRLLTLMDVLPMVSIRRVAFVTNDGIYGDYQVTWNERTNGWP